MTCVCLANASMVLVTAVMVSVDLPVISRPVPTTAPGSGSAQSRVSVNAMLVTLVGTVELLNVLLVLLVLAVRFSPVLVMVFVQMTSLVIVMLVGRETIVPKPLVQATAMVGVCVMMAYASADWALLVLTAC